ncbi:Copper chaperone CopZ [Haladaptatus litoreus]|uniref:Copper chaperone CopZ n=1 Tax=Haladaptatus litoreus TaxID=553468 RepID=A0A1N7DW14_9EURY|nr:heavy metal-associated domain-containing protein [Haladaptatus litoreus]SIR80039.1 Copper chaperone CopZ [Haladaptatus litoreus]
MTTTIQVDGMNCGHCEQSVVDALEDLSGVSDASADHEAGTATVESDADTNTDELVAVVEDAGYDASA